MVHVLRFVLLIFIQLCFSYDCVFLSLNNPTRLLLGQFYFIFFLEEITESLLASESNSCAVSVHILTNKNIPSYN